MDDLISRQAIIEAPERKNGGANMKGGTHEIDNTVSFL